jgi:undecaprenyl diphosphate synthase
MNNLPKHIVIVMDGNGRWAEKRKLPRIFGHREGGKAAEKIIESCVRKRIDELTLFAFSTENWKRPQNEVGFLMELFLNALNKDVKRLHRNNIRLRIIGDINALNEKLRNKIMQAEELTSANTGLKLNIAINYSGRWDIFQAAKNIALAIESGELKTQELTQEIFENKLCLSDSPEPDLFIRTSGEVRISNFLLWQLAYTELYFTDILWPDFDEQALDDAIHAYINRERRFGVINNLLNN